MKFYEICLKLKFWLNREKIKWLQQVPKYWFWLPIIIDIPPHQSINNFLIYEKDSKRHSWCLTHRCSEKHWRTWTLKRHTKTKKAEVDISRTHYGEGWIGKFTTYKTYERKKIETNNEACRNAAKCHKGQASVENPDSPRYEETLHKNDEDVCTYYRAVDILIKLFSAPFIVIEIHCTNFIFRW